MTTPRWSETQSAGVSSGGSGGTGGSGGGSSGGTTVINNVTIVNTSTDVTNDSDATTASTAYYADASSGDLTLTLPEIEAGIQFFFKKTDKTSNKVIVSGEIDGRDAVWLTETYDALHVLAGTSEWHIV